MPIYTPLRFRISPSPRNPKKNQPRQIRADGRVRPGRTLSARRRHPTRRRHVSPRDRIAAAVPAREAQEGPPRARAPAPLPPLGRRRLPDLRRPAPSPPPHRPPPRRAPPPVRSTPRRAPAPPWPRLRPRPAPPATSPPLVAPATSSPLRPPPPSSPASSQLRRRAAIVRREQCPDLDLRSEILGLTFSLSL